MRPSLGLFLQGWATDGCSDSDVVNRTLDMTELAEELGFDAAWFTEQHSRVFGGIWGRITAPQLLIAHAAARTERIELGTAVRLVAGLDSAAVAEEFLTLDILAPGRVHFGVGAGQGDTTLDRHGREQRRREMRECVDEVVDILAGQSQGNAVLQSRDLTGRIYLASNNDRSIEFAARRGLGFLIGMFGGARHADTVAGFRLRGGRFSPVRAARMVYVADSDDVARRQLEPALRRFWRDFTPPSPGWRQALEAAGPLGYREMLDQLGLAVGDPDSVTRQLVSYGRASDLDGLDVSFDMPGLDPRLAERSMRLYAREVMPRLR